MLPFLPPVREYNGPKINKKRILLENFSRYEIRKHCGVDPEYAMRLFNLVKPLVEPLTCRNNALTAETQTLIALSFLRSGSFQYVEGSVCGASQSTISRVIEKFSSNIVSELGPTYIHFSPNPVNFTKSKIKFHEIAGVPSTVGVIDRSHVLLRAPYQNENSFVNQKGTHSINTQIVCDYDYSFKDVVAKWPGCTHDAYMWRFCGLKQRFLNKEFGNSWLLGDAGYGVEPCLLTPLNRPQNQSEINYNKCYIKTRTLVERTIGTWKSRFCSMDRTGGALCYEPAKVCRLILTTSILHNYFIKNGATLIEDDEAYLNTMIHDHMTSPEGIIDDDCGLTTRNDLIRNYFPDLA